MINFNSKIVMRDDMFNAYNKDFRSVYTPDEERGLIEAYHNGDQSARDKIIMANQGMVIKIAKSYTNSENLMDLISVGNMGLMTALEKFDPNNDKGTDGKPAKFMSFAVWYIRRDITNYIIEESQTIQKSNYNKTYSKVNKIKNDFYQREMRYPSIDEIREILDEQYNTKIKNDGDLYDVSYTSINTPVTGNDDDEAAPFENSSVFNSKTASYNEYEETVEKEQLHDDMMRLLNCLKDRERTIMMMSSGMGYDREYTNEEIAERLDLSTERVRQLRISSAAKMKKMYPKIVGHAV